MDPTSILTFCIMETCLSVVVYRTLFGFVQLREQVSKAGLLVKVCVSIHFFTSVTVKESFNCLIPRATISTIVLNPLSV